MRHLETRAFWRAPRDDRVECHPSVSSFDLLRLGVREVCPDDHWSCGPPWTGRAPPGQPDFAVTANYWAQMSVCDLATPDGSIERVKVIWIDSVVGGRRPLFECPECRARRAKLRFVHGRWLCRQCHGLRYESQLMNRQDRQLMKATLIRRRLGDVGPVGAPLGPKPAHMSALTYQLAEVKILQAELAFLGVEGTGPRIRRSIRWTPRGLPRG